MCVCVCVCVCVCSNSSAAQLPVHSISDFLYLHNYTVVLAGALPYFETTASQVK